MGNSVNTEKRIFYHKRRPTVDEAEVFQKWKVNDRVEHNLKEIVLREPRLQPLEYNGLYQRRTQIKL